MGDGSETSYCLSSFNMGNTLRCIEAYTVDLEIFVVKIFSWFA